MYINAADLLLHDAGVDLAHVAATVRLFELPDVEPPRSVAVVGDADPAVVRNHAVVHREDRLVFGANPTHLQQQSNVTGQVIEKKNYILMKLVQTKILTWQL